MGRDDDDGKEREKVGFVQRRACFYLLANKMGTAVILSLSLEERGRSEHVARVKEMVKNPFTARQTFNSRKVPDTAEGSSSSSFSLACTLSGWVFFFVG
jgi:hypothetical protein